MFNHITERMPNWIKQIALGGVLGIIVYSFKLFHPLTYGFSDASSETNSTMHGLRWLESWEFWKDFKSGIKIILRLKSELNELHFIAMKI